MHLLFIRSKETKESVNFRGIQLNKRIKTRIIEKRSTTELISDYNKINSIESEYWKLLKKYDPTSTFESDAVTVDILLELGRRQVDA